MDKLWAAAVCKNIQIAIVWNRESLQDYQLIFIRLCCDAKVVPAKYKLLFLSRVSTDK